MILQVNLLSHPMSNTCFQIHEDQLAYDTEEYIGELYCMNPSCSDEGLPESGCLFSKVAGNTSTIKDILLM